jgi:glutaredoxin
MFTIYSKKGCKFCTKIKQVMDLSELKYVVYELDRDFSYEEFYEEFGDNSTFPQIVLEGIKLGGCQESIKYMQEQSICCVI